MESEGKNKTRVKFKKKLGAGSEFKMPRAAPTRRRADPSPRKSGRLSSSEGSGDFKNKTIDSYFKKKRSASEGKLDPLNVSVPSGQSSSTGGTTVSKVLTAVLTNTTASASNVGADAASIISDSSDATLDMDAASTTEPESDYPMPRPRDENDVAIADRSPSRSPSPAQVVLKEGEYEVEEILDYDGDLYRVKWKGYDQSDNTWEPIENLTECQHKLYQFYLKRKNEEEQDDSFTDKEGEKPRKRIKKQMPPDPRSLSLVIDDLFENGILPKYSFEELNDVYKLLLRGLPRKRDRWSETRVRKAIVDSNFSEDQKTDLRNQVLYIKAEAAGKDLKEKLKIWQITMNSISNGMPTITTENTIDLTDPPTDFVYINDCRPAKGIVISQDPPMGCLCSDDCAGSKSQCCSKQMGGHHRGYYSSNKKLTVDPGTPIYECNKMCLCKEGCSNRVVQDGLLPLKDKKFCIFQTEGCGWGVKTLKAIRKGSYVCLYVGEIISDAEADRRGKEYDQKGSTYLFDLDFNETDGGADCPYVGDSKEFGNISHFFNHSCDPNLGVYGVWSNCLDPNLPKLAFFAIRDISKGTELTFHYTRSMEPSATANGSERKLPLPPIKTIECRCGSDNCSKFLF